MHAAHVCVHVRRHFCSFAAVRALELGLLPALEPQVLLHVAQVLVAAAALRTPKASLDALLLLLMLMLMLLLLRRTLGGIPVAVVGVAGSGVPEIGEIVTLRRERRAEVAAGILLRNNPWKKNSPATINRDDLSPSTRR